MDKGSVERLRYDRRLQRRLGWIDEADHKAYLASLPDVSEKLTTCAEEEEKAAPETRQEEPALATATAATPTQPAGAGDFSASAPFGGLGGDSGGS